MYAFESIYNIIRMYTLHVYVLSPLSLVRLFVTPQTISCQAPLSMGILQARILERVTMTSFWGSSWPRDPTCVSYISCMGRWVLLPLTLPEKPCITIIFISYSSIKLKKNCKHNAIAVTFC